MSAEQIKDKTDDSAVTVKDILFECPACGKSLAVDESAEGMIVDCPQCRTNVIVPPKSVPSTEPPPTPAVGAKEERGAADITPDAGESSPQKRIAVLAGQLKEIQTQRTEITNRIAARLNEVNRDLVLMARLESSQQQILAEWTQLTEKSIAATNSGKTTVLGASIGNGNATRVAPRR